VGVLILLTQRTAVLVLQRACGGASQDLDGRGRDTPHSGQRHWVDASLKGGWDNDTDGQDGGLLWSVPEGVMASEAAAVDRAWTG